MLAASVETLEQEVVALKLAAETRAKTAMVEDYFVVNEAEIQIAEDTGFSLVDPFCLQGPGVIDFSLAASFAREANTDANVMVDLMIGGQTVARAEIEDAEFPSNLSLSYRGKIEEDVDVMLVVLASDDTTIAPKHL